MTTRLSRTCVACITALLFLLCQSASAARVCAAGLLVPDSSGNPPCHGSVKDAGHAGTPLSGAASVCESSKAIQDPLKVSPLAVTEQPGALAAYRPATSQAAACAVQATEPVGPSPPLPVLHCRLRN